MAASAAYKKRKQSQPGVESSVDRLNSNTVPTEHIVAAVNMMRLSNYQADPIAATMGTRSLGLAKINVSDQQK